MRAFLLAFIASWLAGIAIGIFSWSRETIFVFALGGLLVAWQYRRLYRRGVNSRRLPIGVGCALLIGLGVMYGSTFSSPTDALCLQQESFRVRVATVYRIEENRVQYVVEDESCRFLVFASRFPLYTVGDQLELVGERSTLKAMPPELSGYAAFLRQQGLGATMRFPEVKVLEKSAAANDLASRLRAQVQRTFSEPEAGVVLAMMLGQQGEISERVSDQFRRTGVSHILSISGLHISLIAGLVFILVGFAPISAQWQMGLSLLIIWLYVGLIQFPSPAVRAALFATLILISLRLRWLISWPTVLAGALVIMVSFRPTLLESVAFQLSASAAAGIGLTVFLRRGESQEGVAHFLVSLILVSLGASLATWPLAAYHFGTISLVTLAANIFVVPASSLFLVVSMFGLLISFFVPLVGLLASFGVHLLWLSMDVVTEKLAVLPAAYFSDVNVTAWMVAAYYVLFAVMADVIIRFQKRSWREVWAG